MKVFISWSGERGKELARLLSDWLPRVIQRCEPWFSEEDIQPGAVWPEEIAKNLKEAVFGIICVTPERWDAPWLMYEAGALALQMEKPRLVCPLLLDMKNRELEGPLSQYQVKNTGSSSQVYDLVKAINRSDDQAILERYLSSSFKKNWEEFQKRVQHIIEMKVPPDILSDITFDCTKDEFINHLHDCDEVTILGITNRSLPGCLNDAWEKRKETNKGPWNKVEIIFPAKHLLKDMPFPGIEAGPKTLETLHKRWENGVATARQFLRSYTNPDNPTEKRAQYVEIRSYDKPFPFVGQMFDNSRLRVAYILPDKDIRSNCYINLQINNPPCRSPQRKGNPSLECDDAPPCKKRNGRIVNCNNCGWMQDHSPCNAIFNAFKKISTASTPLLAANIIGRIKNREDPQKMEFVFSSLRPQNNWRETISVAGYRPVHLLAFVILRVGNEACLLLRTEHNSSGEFGKYGVLPGKVNDVDFFPTLPDERYRGKVYEMQKAWDTRATDYKFTNFKDKAREASDLFVELLEIKKGIGIDPQLLDEACSRAAVRSIYERVGLQVEPDRLAPQKQTFLVEQGDYELFIRCFVLELEIDELDMIDNQDIHRKCADDLRSLKSEGKLTDFLMKYNAEIIGMLSSGAG